MCTRSETNDVILSRTRNYIPVSFATGEHASEIGWVLADSVCITEINRRFNGDICGCRIIRDCGIRVDNPRHTIVILIACAINVVVNIGNSSICVVTVYNHIADCYSVTTAGAETITGGSGTTKGG